MQTLKLIGRGVAGALDDRRHGQRIMRRELRENARRREQTIGAGDVIQIRHRLAREHRIIGEAALLRALHLCVPIGAFDEADHEAPTMRFGERRDMIDHRGGALLIGLNGETKAIPAGERRIGDDRVDDIERQLEAIGLLGVDGEDQIVTLGEAREREQARREFAQHALARQRLEARMQRGELDGDARPLGKRARSGLRAYGRDRCGVGREVALGVRAAARALAQHIEGIAPAARVIREGARERFVDRFAEHEMTAHQLHRLPRGATQRRHAEPPRCLRDEPARRLLRGENLRRQSEREGRRLHQQRIGGGRVAIEGADGQLVDDEQIERRIVRNAQERFGERHQRQPLARRQ